MTGVALDRSVEKRKKNTLSECSSNFATNDLLRGRQIALETAGNIRRTASRKIFGICARLVQEREATFVPAMPRPFQLNMYPDGLTSNGSDDPNQVDPWVQAQLSNDQVRWLKIQGGAVNQPELLKNALAEWVVRHPEDWFRGTRLSDAIRFSLTEFIDRHKDEFLSLD